MSLMKRFTEAMKQDNPYNLDLEKIAKKTVGLKKHKFEVKNDYKDYPCKCGAVNNKDGSYCWQVKLKNLKKRFTPSRD